MRKVPIVYHHNYNIHLYGLENILHSFDSKKYGKVFSSLCARNEWTYDHFFHPQCLISDEDLLLVHSHDYLASVNNSSFQIARITEVPFLAFIPICIGRPRLLEPMKLASQGTIDASELALEHGWAINLSGGYHHAKANNGEGFCIYADVAVAIRRFMNTLAQGSTDLTASRPPRIRRPLIIDLDAHQGNGYLSLFTKIKTLSNTGGREEELEFAKNANIKIFDVYNGDIYPGDRFARKFIDYDYPLRSGTDTATYMSTLQKNLPRALDESQPDIVFYNAGTDIYYHDPLGALSVTEAGIIQRDEYVFRLCRERNIPIVMVLSGGYTQESAEIIFNSIQNLIDKRIVQLPLDSIDEVIPTE